MASESVREEVRRIIHERGILQRELAERTGLSDTQINRMLNGKRKGLSDSWQRVLDALDLEVTVLPRE